MSEGHWGWISHPLAKADDRPQTEAQCAAAAEAATQEPAHIHWQRLPQTAVYTVDTGFEFLWCHLREGSTYLQITKILMNLCFVLVIK